MIAADEGWLKLNCHSYSSSVSTIVQIRWYQPLFFVTPFTMVPSLKNTTVILSRLQYNKEYTEGLPRNRADRWYRHVSLKKDGLNPFCTNIGICLAAISKTNTAVCLLYRSDKRICSCISHKAQGNSKTIYIVFFITKSIISAQKTHARRLITLEAATWELHSKLWSAKEG